MAIKIEKIRDRKSNYERVKAAVLQETVSTAKERQKRKPTGKAKVAVTLRLEQDVINYYQGQHSEGWRDGMQRALKSLMNP